MKSSQRRRLRRGPLVLFAIAAGGSALVSGGVASAATYPPSAPSCSVAPNPTAANTTVTLTCTGFAPNSTENIAVSGSGRITNASVRSDGNGSFSVSEAVTSAGTATFTATGALVGGTFGSSSATTSVEAAAPIRVIQVGSISNATVVLGSSIIFGGCGYVPGGTVTLTDTAGDHFGSAPINAKGCFSKQLTLGQLGTFTLVATGADATVPVNASRSNVASGQFAAHISQGVPPRSVLLTTGSVRVIDGASVKGVQVSRNGTGLAFTGADDLGLMILTGVLLLAGGSGLVAGARRRRLLGH